MQFGLWRRPRVVAGRVYVVPDLGTIRVTAVEKVDLARITPWEAEASGAKDLDELRGWLKKERPDANPSTGIGYRVRFRLLGTDDKAASDDPEAPATAAEDEEEPSPPKSTVAPKPIPSDLMGWVAKKPWRAKLLSALTHGIWRNADDIARDVDLDSATTRRRMGDLRKRGLVTSHRHHGYRITPEGQGALQERVEEGSGTMGEDAASWLAAKSDRMEIVQVLRDAQWHNAAVVAEAMNLSVVSVQRRVAALRDRGLIESHRRRGYRLTKAGLTSIGLEPAEEGTMAEVPGEIARGAPPHAVEAEPPQVPETEVDAVSAMADGEETETADMVQVEDIPVPASILEWLDKKDYRKTLLLALDTERFTSSGKLSDLLGTSVTALHGRLKTLRERDLVTAEPRHGYRLSLMGARTAALLRGMTRTRTGEPAGAEDFLRAEPPGWTPEGSMDAPVERVHVTPVRGGVADRWGSGAACGFCHSSGQSPPEAGWVEAMQNHLEVPTSQRVQVKPIPSRRGIFEDAYWFLIVERNPLAEGHCKLVCKEHIDDLMELSQWAQRDPKLAKVRDKLTRDLLLAIEVVKSLDPRIVDVMVVNGMEYGVHLHFDLIPRYRMDLPGIRPLASARAHYDDLSLVRKRRLWDQRKKHLEEVANRLRGLASNIIRNKGVSEVKVPGP
jgi:Mn-dependent DtxR family transcriptional regulator/diadenosine tetraphosphate (Ap4A) HIT family hydrolase